MRRNRTIPPSTGPMTDPPPPSVPYLAPPPAAVDRQTEGLFAIAAAIDRLADVLAGTGQGSEDT
jgi:hypothetical protein